MENTKQEYQEEIDRLVDILGVKVRKAPTGDHAYIIESKRGKYLRHVASCTDLGTVLQDMVDNSKRHSKES